MKMLQCIFHIERKDFFLRNVYEFVSKHNKEGERTKGNPIKSQSGKYHVISHSFRHEVLEVNVIGASWRLN